MHMAVIDTSYPCSEAHSLSDDECPLRNVDEETHPLANIADLLDKKDAIFWVTASLEALFFSLTEDIAQLSPCLATLLG